jgi:hypothetical protein
MIPAAYAVLIGFLAFGNWLDEKTVSTVTSVTSSMPSIPHFVNFPSFPNTPSITIPSVTVPNSGMCDA